MRISPRSRTASPVSPRTRAQNKSHVQKYRENLEFPESVTTPVKNTSVSVADGVSAVTLLVPEQGRLARHQRVALAVKRLERDLEDNLKSRRAIGQVTERRTADKVHIKSRRVTFTWQRGIKIGE